MPNYQIINSKTGDVAEESFFASGGDAKKYADLLGRNYYAKRVYDAVPTGGAVEAVEVESAPLAETITPAIIESAPAVAESATEVTTEVTEVRIVESSTVGRGAGSVAIVTCTPQGHVVEVLQMTSSYREAVALAKFKASLLNLMFNKGLNGDLAEIVERRYPEKTVTRKKGVFA